MNGFTGTGTLLRLAARRDRIQLPVWLFGLTGLLAASAGSVIGLYETEADRLNYATVTSANAVARAFNGVLSGPSLGAITVVETYTTTAVLAGLMSIFAVVRHTRQNEETGRAEMIEAGVVGRHAAVTAAVVLTTIANIVLAALVFAVLAGTGLPAAGSALTGAAIGCAGIVFTAVTAVTAQIAQSTRAASGLAAAVLAISFLLRAAGDALGEVAADGMSLVSAWPSWLSPLSWGQQARPFRDDTWWLLLLPLGVAAALCALAYPLITHRDLGAGMLPVRRGPATASRWLVSPTGLAWRLQRGVLLGWTIGVAVTGLVLGAVADAVDDMSDGNQQLVDVLRQLGGGTGDLTDMYFGGMLGIIAIAVAGYTVQALLRPRTEEASGFLEPVLATSVGRTRWLAGHALLASVGSAVLLLVAGASTGLAYGLIAGDIAGETGRLAVAALGWLPATLALGGFVLVVFGVLPRLAAPLAWAGLTACLLMGQVGVLFDLPQWVLNVSPFTHVPAVPSAAFDALPLAYLAAVSLALAAAGLAVFHRRDLSL